MEPVLVHALHEAFFYDGGNGVELVGQLNSYKPDSWELVSEDAGTAVVRHEFLQTTFELVSGYAAVVPQGDTDETGFYSPEVFAEWFVAADSVILGPPVLAQGIASVPALNGGASTTVNVPVTPELPDTSYTAAAVLLGGTALLASLTVTATSKISGAQVDVTVQNTGLLPLSGASVLVAAVDQS